MDFRDYATQYFLCILRIELLRHRDVSLPKNGPVWLIELIEYLFSEYAHSRDALYAIGEAFSLCDDFASLKNRLLNLDQYDPKEALFDPKEAFWALEEANDKCLWKEK